MERPLITIICISYNHEHFLAQALNSVWNLAYDPVQLIIADDASTDKSQKLIKALSHDWEVELVLNKSNIGHCKTFNKALKLAKGAFVIDFSADDVLLPESITHVVERFSATGDSFGVLFADAEHINEDGNRIGRHLTPSFFNDGKVPQGNIYNEVLGRYFICPPTMVYRKSLLDQIGGYNENLFYEDFDFWIRSSRITNYCYLPTTTVQKRIHPNSVSSRQYTRNSNMLVSTLVVCKTAFCINTNKEEDYALLKRIMYEAKMALGSHNILIGVQLIILAIKVLFKFR